jgi:uncharacterized Tic20 family protein
MFNTPTSESRIWSSVAHLAPLLLALVSAGTLAFVAPLSVWLLRRNEDRFAAEHARASLNFQLTMLAFVFVAGVIGKLTLGLGWIVFGPLLLAFFVVEVVLCIVGAVRAMKGYSHHYPLSFSFVG